MATVNYMKNFKLGGRGGGREGALHRHLDISWAIIAENFPLQVVVGLEPGTFGFRAHVANH